ncbi:MAG: type II secretion system protein GspE [Lysobacterales bacterium RIFOXYD1_FULL_69_11]|nr:MAG: type II secretion system protein GspE [Xanthomonadales bacterium RIFOXYA1_FULL_69_10]OHE86326.1 MAG: type II secretion system protein GspE [Xanthomonadales bacterium RIFOXYD1_FULL_69_11]
MTATLPPLPYGFAKQHGVLVLDASAQAPGEPARVGLREGAAPTALLEARRVLARRLMVEPMASGAFDRRLSEVYADAGLGTSGQVDAMDPHGNLDALVEEIPAAADLLESQDDAPVIRLINGVIAEGVRLGASDIHIEPFEAALRVRFRVDGVMREAVALPARIAPLLVSRVKVMARLDIAEKRVPQDGRISLSMGTRALDVRVSTLPARGGERVVLRILDKESGALALEQLGMPPAVLEALRGALRQPNGIVLVTGPTGSGKTTTLYAGLASLNDGRGNILTVEDPVEYAIDGIGQTQVNAKVGMTFAAGLRAILRQDPDVVMVGEIRDTETAQIAVQASLTGHLVLSTVHTNDAVGAITRLRDMGVEPFLLASTVRLILAQRLLRRLCTQCRAPREVEPGDAAVMGPDYAGSLFRAVGCPACNHTGYAGRLGVYEAVRIDDTLRRLIGANADEDALAAAAFARSDRLESSARACIARGDTTVEEALRVTRQVEGGHGDV